MNSERRARAHPEGETERSQQEAYQRALAAGELTDHDLLEDAEDYHHAPAQALIALGLLQAHYDELEDSAVLAARVEGMSWGRIGMCLGRSKQAVWEKHRDPQDTTSDD